MRRFEAQMVNEEWRQPYGTQLWQGPGATSAVHSALRGYLLARRVPTWVWPEADLRGDGDRVVIPIKGLHGEWCGSVARSLAGGYRYPRGMPRGQVMFNQSALYVETDEPVAIVEGVFDALPHWPHAVACLGKPSTDQYALLCGARRPLAIVLDRDASTEAWSLVQKLRLDGQRAWHVSTEPYDDPGDMPRVQFLARIGVTK